MNEIPNPLFDLTEQDGRYKSEAYEFIRMALAFAHDVMERGTMTTEELAELGRDATSEDAIPE